MGARLETLLLYTDGASRHNPGDSAICFRILSPERLVLTEHAERIGRATNNQAEYRALIAGLEASAGWTSGTVQCRSDSQLMVRQMRGEYRVKDELLRPLWDRAQQLTIQFGCVEFAHVLRTDPDIVRADQLANQALDSGAC